MNISHRIVKITLTIGYVCLGLSLLWSVLMVVGWGGWPSILPFILVVISSVVLGLGYLGRKYVFFSYVGLLIVILILGTRIFLVDVVRDFTFKMTWKYGKPHEELPNAKHIILTFKHAPSFWVEYYSNELSKYLESQNSKEVDIKIRVTYDLGKVRGYNIVQVGSLKKWKSVGYSGGSVIGPQKESPFPRVWFRY